MTFDPLRGFEISHNLLNLSSEVRIPAGTGSLTEDVELAGTVFYADGTRAGVIDPGTGEWASRYIGSLIYSGTDGSETLDGIVTADGFIDCGNGISNPQMQYFLRDHLGSVRVIAADRDNVLRRTDYLPFGARMTGNGLPEDSSSRSAWFGFAGKENEQWDAESSTPHWLRGERYQHFGARTYDPASCIFLQTDPLAEKYYGFSPYAYCDWDPVNCVDPDGKSWYFNIDNGEFFVHIEDNDDLIYMISQRQYEDAISSGDINQNLQALKEDNNLFGYIFNERNTDTIISSVVHFFYDYANVVVEGCSDKIYPYETIIIVEHHNPDNNLFSVVSSDPNTIRIYKDHPHFRGYDIMTYLTHEIKHQLDLINGKNYISRYHREIAADDFTMKHWAYEKAANAPEEIRKHRKSNLQAIGK